MDKRTRAPWREPYMDTLPNGLRAVRIDSSQADGVSVIALLPVGDGSDLEINDIQHANARLIAAAPELLEIAQWAIASIAQLECLSRNDADKAEFRRRRNHIYNVIAKTQGE